MTATRLPGKILAAGTALLVLSLQPPLFAQGCAMCKSSLASLQSIAEAINLGILILLFPPLLIMSTILFVAYRRGSGPEDS